jgi:two-component system, chemotaxis family, chemotaxis protein CheY
MHTDEPMKTLIVEDDFTSRFLLQSFLAPYGECHAAVNGREAVEAFQQMKANGGGFDLICMDIMMPEVDGQTALKEIRALEQSGGVMLGDEVKIIMVTAVPDMKVMAESFRLGCDAYLRKPVDTGELLRYLKSFSLVS